MQPGISTQSLFLISCGQLFWELREDQQGPKLLTRLTLMPVSSGRSIHCFLAVLLSDTAIRFIMRSPQ